VERQRSVFVGWVHDDITVSRTGDLAGGLWNPAPHQPQRAAGHPREVCGTLADVLATVSFFYGHRDPVSVTAG
jgi:hypothetical protein